ncbi:MAG TPA: VOC family protein [Bacteroidia bacterium]|jgi:PhnB protein|nr:VOC family protein [Bacteroidia bacterium]HQF27652.1 VOC family protein [Bacteroidia bacterium]HQK98169.1 VOC family protein [Bacteroidia bacterium]
MRTIQGYLTFNGSCKSAMEFYRSCLGGELEIQKIGESPLADKMPESMKDLVLHATLSNGSLQLMASDMVPESGLLIGNNVSLILNCSDEEEIKIVYEKLSEGGKKDHPLEISFWGALFGDLTDKFGNHWLLHCNNN